MIPHASGIAAQRTTLCPTCILCDTCDEPIASASDGWLEWLVDADEKTYGMRIVHRASVRRGCHLYTDRPNRCGAPLDFFTDAKGIAYWLNRIDQGRVRDAASVRRVILRILGRLDAMNTKNTQTIP